MSRITLRLTAPWGMMLALACAPSARSNDSSASATAEAARDPTRAAARDTTRLPARVTRPESTVASGGPERLPTPPRSSGCGGVHLDVTVKASALAASGDATASLRAVSAEVLAPVRGQVGSIQLSPAIRAFRVSVRDSNATPRIMVALKASPKVESVERDVCAVMR